MTPDMLAKTFDGWQLLWHSIAIGTAGTLIWGIVSGVATAWKQATGGELTGSTKYLLALALAFVIPAAEYAYLVDSGLVSFDTKGLLLTIMTAAKLASGLHQAGKTRAARKAKTAKPATATQQAKVSKTLAELQASTAELPNKYKELAEAEERAKAEKQAALEAMIASLHIIQPEQAVARPATSDVQTNGV